MVNHMALAGLPQGWTDPQALVSRAALSIYPWAGSSAKAGNGSKTEPLCSPSSQKINPIKLLEGSLQGGIAVLWMPGS